MKLKNLLGYRPSFNASQSMSANIIGFKKQYFKSYHSARPQIKSSIANFYKENPKMLKKQIMYKFRITNNICLIVLLASINKKQ